MYKKGPPCLVSSSAFCRTSHDLDMGEYPFSFSRSHVTNHQRQYFFFHFLLLRYAETTHVQAQSEAPTTTNYIQSQTIVILLLSFSLREGCNRFGVFQRVPKSCEIPFASADISLLFLPYFATVTEATTANYGRHTCNKGRIIDVLFGAIACASMLPPSKNATFSLRISLFPTIDNVTTALIFTIIFRHLRNASWSPVNLALSILFSSYLISLRTTTTIRTRAKTPATAILPLLPAFTRYHS